MMHNGVHRTSSMFKALLIALLCISFTSPAFAGKTVEEGSTTVGKEVVPEDKLPPADQRSTQPQPAPDIVGGTTATAGEYPWQARVAPSGYSIFCGGTLIATQWVLTASHCVDGRSASSFTVTLGDHNVSSNEGTEQARSVSQIIMHPSYNSSTLDNDVALMKLSSPVTLNARVQTIPLVNAPADDSLVANGILATVTGWGATSEGGSSSSVLRKVQVPIVSNTTCNSAYGGGITANMICAGYSAGGKDSCQGDSGGPFVVANGSGWKLAGVVSWGDGCARANKYGVYARVSRYISWIESYVGSSTPPPPPPSSGITNGGFENGATGWSQSSSGGYAIIDDARPRSGSYSGWMAGYNNASDKLYQTVSVPASGGTLGFYVYVSTQETSSTSYDYLRVRVYSTSGSLLGTLRTYSNGSTKNSWFSGSASLANWAGQTVRIQFDATNDSSYTTSFFVDDVTLN